MAARLRSPPSGHILHSDRIRQYRSPIISLTRSLKHILPPVSMDIEPISLQIVFTSLMKIHYNI